MPCARARVKEKRVRKKRERSRIQLDVIAALMQYHLAAIFFRM